VPIADTTAVADTLPKNVRLLPIIKSPADPRHTYSRNRMG
jgi:hypothetical protein